MVFMRLIQQKKKNAQRKKIVMIVKKLMNHHMKLFFEKSRKFDSLPKSVHWVHIVCVKSNALMEIGKDLYVLHQIKMKVDN
jgi:hypothetical protein